MARTDISILFSMAFLLSITVLSLIKQQKLIMRSKHSKVFRIVIFLIGAILGSFMICTRQRSFDVFIGLGLFIDFYLFSKLKQGISEDGFLAIANNVMSWSHVRKVEIYNKTHEVQILYYNKRGPSELLFEKKSLNLILHILREHLDDEIIKVINKI